MAANANINVGDTVEFNSTNYFVKSMDKQEKEYRRFIISNGKTEFYLFNTLADFNLIFGEYIYLIKKGIELPQIYYMDERENYIITEIVEGISETGEIKTNYPLEMWFK